MPKPSKPLPARAFPVERDRSMDGVAHRTKGELPAKTPVNIGKTFSDGRSGVRPGQPRQIAKHDLTG